MTHLRGKRVLITGGGSGVGADLARGFCESGAEVVISGRRADTLARVVSQYGVRAIQADVTSETDMKDLFRKAGMCDIVIANAGSADSAPLGRTTLEQWQAMLSVNLTGVFLTLREGLNQMTGWGRLITIASVAGLKGYPKIAAYAASKHGVIGLTRVAALEVARRDITVNAICPGYLDTDMTDHSVKVIMEKTGKSQAEARGLLEAMSPQNRLFQVNEVTTTALWLCSPGAEGVNGQAITISGGEP